MEWNKGRAKLLSEWFTTFGYGAVASIVAQVWSSQETNDFLFFSTVVFGVFCYLVSWYIVPEE